MAEFFNMGGYAFAVWGSFGVCIAAFLYHYFAPLVWEKKLRSELYAELQSELTSELPGESTDELPAK